MLCVAQCPASPLSHEDFPLDSATQLNVFLAGAERHAFRHAMLALRNEAAALDAVQEAMMRLARLLIRVDLPTLGMPMIIT